MIEVGPARAATCTVADGDIVNLKTTLTSANAGTGCTEGISLATGGTYTLTVADNTVTNGNGLGGNGLPQISGPGKVVIYGNGATIQRSNAAVTNFRLFYISSTGDLTLDNLTIKGGKIDNGANVNAYGGGLSNAGKLTLTRSTVTSNSSVSSAASTTNIQAGAGGIFNENLATTTLNNSIISNNSAIITVNTAGGIQSGGGGLLNNDTGILNLLNSTVSGNSISVITPTTNAILALGGGISNNGTLNLLNNTVNNNSITVAAGGSVSTVGGGIFSVVTANLANSTVANNSTSSTSTSTTTQIISIGGGIYLNGANAGLASLTIVNNTAGFSGGNNTSIAVGGGI